MQTTPVENKKSEPFLNQTISFIPEPTISVVIVNYNRPREVRDAVESLLNQSSKPFEIIIIDDASTPPLDMKTYNSKIKIVRFDREVGLSASRNYGINIATGDFVAFIDDDCIASKQWIKEIQNGINAGAEILGGTLKPFFKATPPKWWNEDDLGYFVGVGNSEKQQIWGANMIFKKEVFQKIGVFNPNIGRQKGKLLAFEDTILISKGKENFKTLFLPNALVLHLVNARRLTLRYIIRWSYNHGRSRRISLDYGKLSLGHSLAASSFSIFKAMILLLAPIKSKKSFKIIQVSTMVESFGFLI